MWTSARAAVEAAVQVAASNPTPVASCACTHHPACLSSCPRPLLPQVAHNPDAGITRIKLPSGSKKVRCCAALRFAGL